MEDTRFGIPGLLTVSHISGRSFGGRNGLHLRFWRDAANFYPCKAKVKEAYIGKVSMTGAKGYKRTTNRQ